MGIGERGLKAHPPPHGKKTTTGGVAGEKGERERCQQRAPNVARRRNSVGGKFRWRVEDEIRQASQLHRNDPPVVQKISRIGKRPVRAKIPQQGRIGKSSLGPGKLPGFSPNSNDAPKERGIHAVYVTQLAIFPSISPSTRS